MQSHGIGLDRRRVDKFETQRCRTFALFQTTAGVPSGNTFNEKPLRGRRRAYPSVESLDQLWRASQVFGPTMPSAGVAKTVWNALTAASV